MSNERPKRPSRAPQAATPGKGVLPAKKPDAVKPAKRPAATPVAASGKAAAKPAPVKAVATRRVAAKEKPAIAERAAANYDTLLPEVAKAAVSSDAARVTGAPSPARRPGARRPVLATQRAPQVEVVAAASPEPAAVVPPEAPLAAVKREAVDMPEVIPAPLRPPGILIDADDAETFADDMPQFAGERGTEGVAERSAPVVRADPLPEPDVFASDYYARQWGRASLRGRSEHVDEFGFDPSVDARSRVSFEALFRRYFRAAVSGIEYVPASGRALLVANHSGTFPWDGVMLKTAIRLEHPARRELRWLTEDFVYHFPFLGTFLSRIGAVRANPENAERLLARDALVAVFPEGVQGIGKLYRQRYQLQRFGRGGYVKLALRSGAPLIPTAIVGAEETNPLLFKVGWLSKLTGLPYLPITATFPWLGPLGLVPLPARWKVVFGPPIDLSEYGPEGADDAILVNRLNERVRATIQALVDDAVEARGSALFG